MQKLSKIPAPALAGVVKEKNVAQAIAGIRNCAYGGATMIDLHLPCLENSDVESLRSIITSSSLPVLALNYQATNDDEAEAARVESLLRAVEAGAAGIDIQGYTLHYPSKYNFCGEDKYSFTKGAPKEVVTDPAIIEKQCALIERVHSMGAEVLLSCHPRIAMSSTQVVELALFLQERSPDIIKIVTSAENEDDLMESIRAMTMLKQEVKTPVSYHVNGKMGKLSRIINPLLGGQIAFCVERYVEGSDVEQVELRTAKAVLDNVRRILI